jgi:hypothetical protein
MKLRVSTDGTGGGHPWTKGAVDEVLANHVYSARRRIRASPIRVSTLWWSASAPGTRRMLRWPSPHTYEAPLPGPPTCVPEGPALRAEQPADVAELHAPARSALSLLHLPRLQPEVP